MNKATYTVEVPPDRVKLVEELSSRAPLKLMIVGDTDSGKTTLATFLANELISLGHSVAIVDADVGQKGILPPATISLAFPEEPFESFAELTGVAHYFIGTVSPSQFAGEMAVGVKRLTDMALREADVVIIDTTGFVSGIGAEMKRLKAELVRPDVMVLLERRNELGGLAKSLSKYGEVIRLGVSELARVHSREERREVRFSKWRAYFKGASPIEVNLGEIQVTGTSLFSGRPLTVEEKALLEELFKWVILAGWKGNRYTVVKADVEAVPHHYSRALQAVDFDRLSNLLVGFIDGDGLCPSLGVLKWVNFTAGTAQVLTPLDSLNGIEELRFGRMRVLETGEELGLLRREEL
ncbi:Clp1/GlmU family protein [Thermococcus sp.]|uniref:Clp1/GlmU family protein n=1 Tax=Thermococcus sp. TaxID=35749 RepID=UPI002635B9F1|nr:Clp1/GlmU family protein [Thermococcus sp.]